GDLYQQLFDLRNTYGYSHANPSNEEGLLFTGSQAEALAWAKRLGMPESVVTAPPGASASDLTWTVAINMAPIDALMTT
ncbi:IpaD/SipD/SspD family type III secretion system needle tip protein, partial [Mucilaginibacter sp. 10I4]